MFGDWFWMIISLLLLILIIATVLFATTVVMWWEAVESNKSEKDKDKATGLSKAELRRNTLAAQRYDAHLAKLKAQNMRVKYRSR